MEAIIRTVYGESKGKLANKKNREPHEEWDEDDEEFTIQYLGIEKHKSIHHTYIRMYVVCGNFLQ